MITPRYCQVMAAYGRHMNARLLEVCAPLGEAALREDRGAFFGSIFRTLEHVLFGDKAWMSRFAGEDYRGSLKLGSPVAASFEALRSERTAFDEIITDWAHGVSQAWLDGELRYAFGATGQPMKQPCSLAVTHMFNHATHHRGQTTTLLSQLGIDPGTTDLPFLAAVTGAFARGR